VNSIRRLFLASALLLFPVSGLPAAAQAAPSPGWTLDSFATPVNFSTADNANCLVTSDDICDAYQVTATNAGSQQTDGSNVTLTDSLPAGLTVKDIQFFWHGPGADFYELSGPNLGHFFCNTTTLTCTIPSSFGFHVFPDDTLKMIVNVTVDDPNASGPLTNSATVSGGGAPDAHASSQNTPNLSLPFGTANFSNYIAAPDGQPDTQAGDHPYELTTRIDLNTAIRIPPDGPGTTETLRTSVEDLKDVVVDLPIGFAGSALATPQCTFAQLSSFISNGKTGCPSDTVVGHIRTLPVTDSEIDGPLYNMVPERGVAAEFAFADATGGSHVLYSSVVPTPAGYVLRTTAPDTPQIRLTDIVTTFFGNPAVKDSSGNTPVAMFTNPTECSGQPLVTAIHMDSWKRPGRFNANGTPDFSDPNWASSTTKSPPVGGCNTLDFSPTLQARPTTNLADSPSGLHVDLHIPQSEDPSGRGTANLRKATVTLPEGLVINPSGANGLQGCSSAQIGIDPGTGVPNPDRPNCLVASKIGTVEVDTPLLANPLLGAVYVATPHDNPFDSLLAIYVAVDDPQTGIVIKLAGHVEPNPVTGRLRTTFDDNPQQPFSDFKLDFFGGATASLRTPATCGTYSTTSELTPYSAPDSGPPATPSDTYSISQGPNGSACSNSESAEPNSPSFDAGTVTPIAAAYSPFVVHLRREDGSQRFASVTVTPPPGLLGKLAGTPYCPQSALDAAAAKTGAQEKASPSCPAASQLGTVTVGAGAGPAPYYTAGKAYLTGPYKNAPLSLAIVTPATAGPFDLGTVVVRTTIQIDQSTGQITAVSDPIPQILQGIPLDIRSVAIALDKPNFSLNPTSCDPMAVNGQLLSTLGQAAALSSHFQLGECGRLAFKPKLAISLEGATRRGANPALRAVLTMPPGGANIARAVVALPDSEFLDQGHIGTVCTRVQFAAQQCPAGSIYGYVKATSPLVDYPLEGPVYLRSSSHKLPDLVAALRGPASQPLEIDAVGRVDSVNGGIRTSFESVPDAPVSRFVLSMPGGNKSLLENSTDICRAGHRATAEFTAQNGKVLDLEPALKNSKCPKRKKHSHHHRALQHRLRPTR
jgi:hypothetical protein